MAGTQPQRLAPHSVRLKLPTAPAHTLSTPMELTERSRRHCSSIKDHSQAAGDR